MHIQPMVRVSAQPASSSAPGLALAAILAAIAMAAAQLPSVQQLGISSLAFALGLGLLLGNLPLGFASVDAGLQKAKGPVLRVGVALFGFQLTLSDVQSIGFSAVLLDVVLLVSTFLLAVWLGQRLFGLDWQTSALIGTGSAICGAAAILAVAPSVKASQAKIAVAVATVVLFGTCSMLLAPVLFALGANLGITAHTMGLFIGATTHEVAQVMVAGQAIGPEVAAVAVTNKLVRVLCLAPFVIAVSLYVRYRQPQYHSSSITWPVPWFAFGFVACVLLNSSIELTAITKSLLVQCDQALLAMAMAALGATTRFADIRRAGRQPLFLAGCLTLFLILGGGLLHAVVFAL